MGRAFKGPLALSELKEGMRMTILLAKVFGMYFLVVGMMLLFNPQRYRGVIKKKAMIPPKRR